jgi:uncharacterized protein (TIGR01777 family)
MKRVVVTGATGFIGQRVASALAARGDAVTALTRGRTREATSETPRLRFEHWAPEDSGALPSLGECDAVVHLAGERAVGVRWTASSKRQILESRVRSTEHLVAAMERAPTRPRVFVCASAVGYYGALGDEPVDEAAPAGSDFLAHVTVEWERAAARAESLGIRVVRARFGIVLGAGGGALAEMVKPFKLFVGGPIGSGKQYVSWVHVDDVVGALLLAVDDDRLRGAMNVVAPNPVTNRELSAAIGAVLKRPSSFAVPAAALRLRFGEGAEPLVSGQRAVPRRLHEAGYAFRFPDVLGALSQALR